MVHRPYFVPVLPCVGESRGAAIASVDCSEPRHERATKPWLDGGEEGLEFSLVGHGCGAHSAGLLGDRPIWGAEPPQALDPHGTPRDCRPRDTTGPWRLPRADLRS